MALLVLATALPAFFAFFYSCKVKVWGQERFKETFGSLLEGTDGSKKRRVTLGAPLLCFLRRILLSVFAILITSTEISLQLLGLDLITLLVLGYLLYVVPYDQKRLMRLDLFNEALSLVIIQLAFVFTDSMSDIQARSDLGICLISVIGLNVAVNAVLLISDAIIKLKTRVKAWYQQRRERANKNK